MAQKPKKRSPPAKDEKPTLSPVARNMATIREGRRWTQKQMSDHLGISLSKLARTEVGVLKPSVEMVSLLRAKLGVSLDDLFRDHPPTPDEMRVQQLAADVRLLTDEQQSQVSRFVEACKGNKDHKVLLKIIIAPQIHALDDA